MQREWVITEWLDEPAAAELTLALNVNPVISQLLVARGINSFDKAKAFFRPTLQQLHNPFFMKDMDKAVRRLNDAIADGERILIYGDYDVDGTTSVALIYSFLREIYDNIDYYAPDRYTEGYGISTQGVDYAAGTGASLIIALDCGIRAVNKVTYAKERGVDFIICDHHLPSDSIPDAAAVLDPKRRDCLYPYDELSGCGIGFKLLQAFCIQNTIAPERLLKYLDLTAVSIASDIVPIRGENRILAWYGMKKLNTQPLPGFKALMAVASFKKALDISDVVFGISPRINAAGRVGHAKSAIELLAAQDYEEAQTLAEKLHLNNIERKEYDESITEEAIEQIEAAENPKEKRSNVLFNPHWHRGIVGIVASRCIDKHYKPTVILTEANGAATGSARSVDGFDVYEAICACGDLLEKYGGHKYAAGLTLPLENVNKFQQRFERVVARSITQAQLTPKIKIDLVLSLSDITYKLHKLIRQMRPFGPGNMQPVFVSHRLVVKNKPRVLKGAHLKMFVTQAGCSIGFDAIGFYLGEFADKLNKPFSMVYTIGENDYRGSKSLQLMIKDVKPDDPQ